jgi:hypothetical protein
VFLLFADSEERPRDHDGGVRFDGDPNGPTTSRRARHGHWRFGRFRIGQAPLEQCVVPSLPARRPHTSSRVACPWRVGALTKGLLASKRLLKWSVGHPAPRARDFVSLHFGLILSRELSFRGLPLSHGPTVLGVPSQRSDGHHKMVDFGLRKERRSPWSPAGCGVSAGCSLCFKPRGGNGRRTVRGCDVRVRARHRKRPSSAHAD